MEKEELGFELSPHVEELDTDVYELVDEGVIGTASEYGFDSAEDMETYFEVIVDAPMAYDVLQLQEENKWKEFLHEYDEAGNIFYNPENGNEWITDDEELDI